VLTVDICRLFYPMLQQLVTAWLYFSILSASCNTLDTTKELRLSAVKRFQHNLYMKLAPCGFFFTMWNAYRQRHVNAQKT